jgi:polysaccharide transporter, PST family
MHPLHKLFKLSFFKQYSWLAILYGFQLLIPYIILPFLLSSVGESGYGKIAFGLSVVAYLIALIDYGFHIYGSRFVSLLENEEEQQKTFFMNVIYTKFSLFFVGSTVLIVVTLLQSRLQDVKNLIFILLLLAFSYVINPQFYLTGKQKVQSLSIITMVIKILYVILVFSFIKDMNDILLYAFIYGMMMFLISFMNLLYVIFKFKVPLIKPKFKIQIQLIKDGFPLFSTSLINQIFLVFGTFYLGFIVSDALVGIYASLLKVTSVVVILYLPLSDAFLPYITNLYKLDLKKGIQQHKNYAKIVVILVILFASLMFIFRIFLSEILLSFDISNYDLIYGMMLLIQIFGIMINISSVQGLIALGKEKLYQKIYVILSVIFISLTLILGQTYEIVGVVFAHFITFFIGVLIFEISYIKTYQKTMRLSI